MSSKTSKRSRKRPALAAVVGGRVALDTPSLRRDFQIRLRDDLGSSESKTWSGIRKLQGERTIARLTPLIDETMASYRRLSDLRKQATYTQAEAKELSRLDARFAGLIQFGPTSAQVHVDAALTTLMATYGQGEYVGDNLLPIVQVTKQTGSVFKRLIQDVQRGQEFTERAAGMEAGEIHWGMDTAVSYSVVQHKAKKGLPDALVSDADAPVDVEEITAQDVTGVIRAGREIRIADLLQTAGTYASANQIPAATVKWDSATTSNNEHWDDIKSAWNAISDATGEAPTDIVMNKRCALALIGKDHFRESVIYVDGALPSFLLGKIAEYCMVDNAHIAFGRKASSNPGQSTQTQADIWSDAVVMLHVGAASTMYKGLGISPATAALAISRYRDPVEDRERTVIWGKQCIDEVVLNNLAGAILLDVLT